MRTLLKGCNLDIDVQPVTIGIRNRAQACDMSFLGRHSVKMVFREEQIHLVIITKTKKPAFRGKRAVGLQIL